MHDASPAGRAFDPLISLGLGGDGDEVSAIEAVERAFSVSLNHADADGWITVGDVFRSLMSAVRRTREPRLWSTFATAIAVKAARIQDV